MSIPAELSAELFGIALKVTLLLILATAIDLLVMRHRASAAARHLLWTLATVGILVLPLVGFLLPEWHVRVSDARIARLADARQAAIAHGSAVGQRSGMSTTKDRSPKPASFASAPNAAEDAGVPSAASSFAEQGPGGDASLRSTETAEAVAAPPSEPRADVSPPPLGAMLFGVYLLGVFLLVVRIIGQRFALRRVERGATPIRDNEWTSTLGTVAHDLGVRRPVSLLRRVRRRFR